MLVDMGNEVPVRGEYEFGMVIEVELGATDGDQISRGDKEFGHESFFYLEYIVTQLEHDDMLHPQVFLNPFHALISSGILKGILIIPV